MKSVNEIVKEEQEEESLIMEAAINLLVSALNAEREKILTDAMTIAIENNREKIEYEDMIKALQKNGFAVLTDPNRVD
jgi:histone H3/H4